MSLPKNAKRFWKETTLRQDPQGLAISLDGRDVKTPAGASLLAPSNPLADAIRDEWDSQIEAINPDTMPMFKFTVTAIDRVTPQRQAIVNEMVNYGCNDLLCYREANDPRLSDHQHQVWQPYLDWIEAAHAIRLDVFSGIMPGDQPEEMRQNLHRLIDAYDDFALAGLHTLVTSSGSLVLGLAACDDHRPIDDIFAAAFLDDLWQQEKWGYDAEADKRLNHHQALIRDAYRYLKML